MRFARFVGIDYSGASTPTAGLSGLRVYVAAGGAEPAEVSPVSARSGVRASRYWTRRGLAGWLAAILREDTPTLVGIDHGFSFPRAYFEAHRLPADWPAFLDDFHRHWPTDGDDVAVDCVRVRKRLGRADARSGSARWRRATERAAGGAKFVFHFDVPGSVAKSTHAGLPWLRHLRRQLGERAHFWPFDGWDIAPGRSAIAEVYPRRWSPSFPREGLTGDQLDAYAVAAALRQADREGRLSGWLVPSLAPEDAAAARFEGWILGVEPLWGSRLKDEVPGGLRPPGTRR
jgi:hypothetical protein